MRHPDERDGNGNRYRDGTQRRRAVSGSEDGAEPSVGSAPTCRSANHPSGIGDVRPGASGDYDRLIGVVRRATRLARHQASRIGREKSQWPSTGSMQAASGDPATAISWSSMGSWSAAIRRAAAGGRPRRTRKEESLMGTGPASCRRAHGMPPGVPGCQDRRSRGSAPRRPGCGAPVR
jgi:hypothetical protein